MPEFDIVIIGSGPAAVGALQGLHISQTVGIVTGVGSSPIAGSQLAPKIQAAAASRGEVPGVAEPLHARAQKPLFSTAAIGGLANYWGQQFVRLLPRDPWPVHLFDDYPAYEAECEAIESLFHLEGGHTLHAKMPADSGFQAHIPRLLTGTRSNPSAGLTAMRQVYQALEARMNATSFNTRARSFVPAGEGWRILLEDGKAILARRVILATGAVGGARLLFRSYPDLEKARLRDHSPWIIYAFGLGSLLAVRPGSAPRHINGITLEQIECDRCTCFVSIYDMRHADLNLIMALTLGIAFPFLSKWRAPPGVSLIKPVQIWTAATEQMIEIDAQTVTAVGLRKTHHPDADRRLAAGIDVLKCLGAHVLYVGHAALGRGFHYHKLEMKSARGTFKPIAELLRERTGDGIVCVDASILPAIGQRPHTLTMMASARRIAQQRTATRHDPDNTKCSVLNTPPLV